jgi:nitrogen fixation-related uncharacterized protein
MDVVPGGTRELWSPSCAEWPEVVLLTMIGFFCKFLISEAWMCLTCFFNVWTHCTYGEEQKGWLSVLSPVLAAARNLCDLVLVFISNLLWCCLGWVGLGHFFWGHFKGEHDDKPWDIRASMFRQIRLR